MDSLDPFGEKNALRELGLAKGASQEEIRTKYRELSKVIKNHFQNQFAGCFYFYHLKMTMRQPLSISKLIK